jgi:fatty acid desaturase
VTDDTPDPTGAAPGPGGFRDLPPVTERELAARRRGLASAYIAGGDDPDPERTRRQEARYIRLLVIMVVAIVGSGLLATFVGLALAGPAR